MARLFKSTSISYKAEWAVWVLVDTGDGTVTEDDHPDPHIVVNMNPEEGLMEPVTGILKPLPPDPPPVVMR